MNAEKKYIYDITSDPNTAFRKIFSLLSENLDILEVGCASGVQTRYYRDTLNCRVTGIEINADAAEDARPFCENILVGGVDEIDLEQALGDKRFDAILFSDVLEHIRNPTDALKRVRPFLKKDGAVIASIPNITHAAICWEIAHGRFDYQQLGLLDDTHIRFFSRKKVAQTFSEAGFKITDWDRVVRTPYDTEFKVFSSAYEDQAFLEWIARNNADSETYQFIVKAVPTESQDNDSDYNLLSVIDKSKKLEEKLDYLQDKNKELVKEVNKYKSQISWLEQNRFGALSKVLNKFTK